MRIPRLFVELPMPIGSQLELPQKQSNYLCKVLRMEAGRELRLFNGQGGQFMARIALADPKKAQVTIEAFDGADRQSPLQIELGIALSKGDRFDLVVQKATELGVHGIQPLLTDRIDVRLNPERMNKKLDHWRGIAISACEQSGRNLLPTIEQPVSLDDWCAKSDAGNRMVLDPLSGNSIKDLKIQPGQQTMVLIGPEGGLSEREIDVAQANQFIGISLGPRILRTETAPLAIISILQALHGDF